MKANKKLIQQQLSQETGNIILLKDLSNIATAHNKEKSRNDLEQTVKTLMDNYGELYCCKQYKGFFLLSWQFFLTVLAMVC